MRYKRVLLINTSVPNSYLGPIRPPAGLGYVAQALQDSGIDYDVIDLLLGYSEKELETKIEEFKPDLIGFSLFTYMHNNSYHLIEYVRKLNNKFDIVAGGPHVSTLREKVLQDCASIDFGVVSDGEETLIELCNGKPVEEITGLIRRDSLDNVIYNGDRKHDKNLDKINFPRYEKFELQKYMLKEILLLSSRGCPYRCTYCAANLVVGRRVRMRSAQSVVDEIVYWHEKGYRRFNFGDDNFTFYDKRVYQFCDIIEKLNLSGLDLRCGNGIRADRVSRQMLERMRSVGFTYIAFGVEAGNDRMLSILKKGEHLQAIEESIKKACDLGYDVTLFFLLGSPYETWDDIEDSFKLATKYPVMDVRFYNLIPYPNTELFDWVSENNYFIRQPEEYLNTASVFINDPIFETPELSINDRIKALERADNIRKTVLRLAMERRLKRFGLLGKLGAKFFSSDFGLKTLRHNKTIRALAEQTRGSRAR